MLPPLGCTNISAGSLSGAISQTRDDCALYAAHLRTEPH
jgi:hypothetical protein